MARGTGSLGDPGRLIGALLSRPSGYGRSRRSREHDVGLSLRPNAPKGATVLASILLTLAGLSQTILSIQAIDDLLARFDVTITPEYAWIALIASPLLLIAGSFFRGL